MSRASVGLLLLAGFAAAPAAAQIAQYTAPGALSATSESTAEVAKKSAESARWKLGKVALDPRFKVRDLGYYENVFASADETSAIDDVRGTIGAGLAAHLRFGSKSLITGYVAPEYSWWQDQSELSRLTVNWGAGWFGFFNNLTATANVSLTDQERPLSDEVDAPVGIETERLELGAELSLNDVVGLLASTRTTKTRHASDVNSFVPGLAAMTLDRDSETVSAGLTLTIRRWKLAAGLESTQVDLLIDPEGRSNSGDSPFAALEYHSERIEFELTGVDRKVEFTNPDLAQLTFTAGSGRLRLGLRPTMALTLYGARSLGLSALSAESVTIQDRAGASLTTDLGARFELTLLTESGNTEFRAPSGSARRDDLSVSGLSLVWQLREDVGLRADFRDTQWDSSLDVFDRSQRSVGINLVLGVGLFPW